MFLKTKPTKAQIITSVVTAFLIGALTTPRSVEAVKGEFLEPMHYKIAQGDGFAPFDTPTGFPSGFSTDILNAVCDANVLMDCEVVFDPDYANCIDVDSVPGPNLLDDEIVGCLTWFRLDSRLLNGLTPTAAYSGTGFEGNDTVILSEDVEVDPLKELAFVEGFVGATPSCASDNGHDYAGTVAVFSPQDAIAAVDAVTDAVILESALPSVLPANVSIIETLDCVDDEGTTVMTYPPAMPVETQSFIENFNCGLSLIAANGTYDEICRNYDGGDTSNAPFCFDSSEIPPPSKKCEKLEDKSSK